MFTGESGHQKHGCYILKNSEIFGLKSSERAIIAQVVRCHRGKPPNQDDKEIAAFNREDRMFILKAASLLRIADALDRSHDQRIKSFSVEKKNGTLILHPQNKENSAKAELSLERLGIQQKGDMFEDVFWYKVLLEQD
jgi:exopolyphosphatase/guanosine-5'-triphosphate,3'-diphosphate pyrophosphatase